MPFRQPIDGISAEIGIGPVETGGFLGVDLIPLLKRPVTEIGRQIDDANTLFQKTGCELTGQSVREAQHRVVSGLRYTVGIGRLDLWIVGKGEEWTARTPALSGTALSPQKGDIEARMPEQKPQRLKPAVTRGTDHRDPGRLR